VVICFRCSSAEVYVDNTKESHFYLTNSPQPEFDKVLTDANVPLPKKEE